MRAATFSRFGGPEVVELRELPTPDAAAGELLVRVEAASVGSSDAAGRSGEPKFARLMFGLRGPRQKVLGSDFAGTIEAVGTGVAQWAPGDRVYGVTGASMNGHAEFIVVNAASAVVPLPDNVTAEQAVALADGGMTALPFLRDSGRLRAGQRVLVNGASSAVGSAAVQLAAHYGAHVTAVTSTPNLALAGELGAHDFIDYTTTDFTAAEARYDIVFDAVGKSSYSRARRILTPTGIYLSTVPGLIILQSMFTRKAAISFTGLRKDADKIPDLIELARLTSSGAISPLIDSSYPLDRVNDAHARVDSGRKRGTVVLVSRR